jgi:hypothetical protein
LKGLDNKNPTTTTSPIRQEQQPQSNVSPMNDKISGNVKQLSSTQKAKSMKKGVSISSMEMLSAEELQQSMENDHIITKKLTKPPPLNEEAKKFAKQALFGNQNVRQPNNFLFSNFLIQLFYFLFSSLDTFLSSNFTGA